MSFLIFPEKLLQAHLLNVSVSSPNSHLQEASVAAQVLQNRPQPPKLGIHTSKCLCSLLSHRFSARGLWAKQRSLLSEDALFALSIWLPLVALLVCKDCTPPHVHPTESSRAISSVSLSLPIQPHGTPFLSLFLLNPLLLLLLLFSC